MINSKTMQSKDSKEFDITVLAISTYIFVITNALRWIVFSAALFSFSSFLWFDRKMSFNIISTTWFLYICIWLVAYIQKATLESIIEVQKPKTN